MRKKVTVIGIPEGIERLMRLWVMFLRVVIRFLYCCLPFFSSL